MLNISNRGKNTQFNDEISLECDEVLISPKPEKIKNFNQKQIITIDKDPTRIKRAPISRRENQDLDLLCNEELKREDPSVDPDSDLDKLYRRY